MATNKKLRPVIVTTEYRGVFFGYASDTKGDVIELNDARMIIYWGTTRGIPQLCETGTTSSTKLSAKADVEVRKVTAVFEVSEQAEKSYAV